MYGLKKERKLMAKKKAKTRKEAPEKLCKLDNNQIVNPKGYYWETLLGPHRMIDADIQEIILIRALDLLSNEEFIDYDVLEDMETMKDSNRKHICTQDGVGVYREKPETASETFNRLHQEFKDLELTNSIPEINPKKEEETKRSHTFPILYSSQKDIIKTFIDENGKLASPKYDRYNRLQYQVYDINRNYVFNRLLVPQISIYDSKGEPKCQVYNRQGKRVRPKFKKGKPVEYLFDAQGIPMYDEYGNVWSDLDNDLENIIDIKRRQRDWQNTATQQDVDELCTQINTLKSAILYYLLAKEKRILATNNSESQTPKDRTKHKEGFYKKLGTFLNSTLTKKLRKALKTLPERAESIKPILTNADFKIPNTKKQVSCEIDDIVKSKKRKAKKHSSILPSNHPNVNVKFLKDKRVIILLNKAWEILRKKTSGKFTVEEIIEKEHFSKMLRYLSTSITVYLNDEFNIVKPSPRNDLLEDTENHVKNLKCLLSEFGSTTVKDTSQKDHIRVINIKSSMLLTKHLISSLVRIMRNLLEEHRYLILELGNVNHDIRVDGIKTSWRERENLMNNIVQVFHENIFSLFELDDQLGTSGDLKHSIKQKRERIDKGFKEVEKTLNELLIVHKNNESLIKNEEAEVQQIWDSMNAMKENLLPERLDRTEFRNFFNCVVIAAVGGTQNFINRFLNKQLVEELGVKVPESRQVSLCKRDRGGGCKRLEIRPVAFPELKFPLLNLLRTKECDNVRYPTCCEKRIRGAWRVKRMVRLCCEDEVKLPRKYQRSSQCKKTSEELRGNLCYPLHFGETSPQ